MKYLLYLALCLSCFSVQAQNRYFFGLDIGPKQVLYQLASGTKAYAPNLDLSHEIDAQAGIVAGVLLDDKVILETGLYRSNFKARFSIVDSDGDRYFENNLVSTFSSLMLPVELKLNKPTSSDKLNYQLGVGFATFLNSTLDFEADYYSQIEENDQGEEASYVLRNNSLEAKLITLNLSMGIWYQINDRLNMSISMTGRYGVAGDNFFDVEHQVTDLNEPINNTIFTEGNGWHANFGFRYFLERDEAGLWQGSYRGN